MTLPVTAFGALERTQTSLDKTTVLLTLRATNMAERLTRFTILRHYPRTPACATALSVENGLLSSVILPDERQACSKVVSRCTLFESRLGHPNLAFLTLNIPKSGNVPLCVLPPPVLPTTSGRYIPLTIP